MKTKTMLFVVVVLFCFSASAADVVSVPSGAQAMKLSPDRQRLYVAHFTTQTNPGYVSVVDVPNRTLLGTTRVSDFGVTDACPSPDGKTLAVLTGSLSNLSVLQYLDATTLTPIRQTEEPAGLQGPFSCVWRADGFLVISAAILNAPTLPKLGILAPDGTAIGNYAGDADAAFYVICQTKAPICWVLSRQRAQHSGGLWKLDQTAGTYKEVQAFGVTPSWMALSPDESVVAVALSGSATPTAVSTSTLQTTQWPAGTPSFLEFSSNNKVYTMNGGGNSYSVFDITTHSNIGVPAPELNAIITGLLVIHGSLVDTLVVLETDKVVFLDYPLDPPQIGSVVNAASFAAGPTAPGLYTTIFGSNLATGTASAPSLPLPTTLASAQVLVDGIAGPMGYASPTQINFVLPYTLSPTGSHTITVSVGGRTSGTYSVAAAATNPALFCDWTGGTCQAILTDAFTGVRAGTTTNPIKAGQAVTLWGTGFGTTNPVVSAADGAPSNPLAYTAAQTTVTIAGMSAQVLFSGLAPGFAGLTQINVLVPQGVPVGTQKMMISVGAITASAYNVFVSN